MKQVYQTLADELSNLSLDKDNKNRNQEIFFKLEDNMEWFIEIADVSRDTRHLVQKEHITNEDRKKAV